MNKTLTALFLAMGLSFSGAQAADYASVNLEKVTDRVTKEASTVEYFRFGKNLGGFQLDVQARNARTDAGVLSQSLEVGSSTGTGPLFVGAGVGHDFGLKQYNYGYVLGGVTQKVGPVAATAGLKYRAGFNSENPTQTLAFAGVAYPLTKDVALTAGLSRSYKDIKENATNVGVKFSF